MAFVKRVSLLLLLPVLSMLLVEEAEGKRGPCPPAMSFVDALKTPYCIDRYEGSTVEIVGEKGVPHSPYEAVTGKRVKAQSKVGVIPQAHISRNEAEAACKLAHKRLCTEEEWVTACKGENPTKFPYGDERKPKLCNDHGTAPLPRICPGADEATMFGPECMNDPRLNQQSHTLAKTGAHEKCKNSFGVFDMVGNVHEWVADPNGTFRGGYYLDTTLNGEGCNYRTDAHDATYHDYSTGFRCCADLPSSGGKK